MASTQQQVRFSGVIRGNGVEADCSGWCLAVSLTGMPPTYTRYSIDHVSKILQDGNYEVFTNGITISLRLTGGTWLAQS
jgi:hypothetical protein